ncbi:MAG TPA: tetratricopeptide repeat protein [Kiritimatiellia bacterium]|nr:tetratricopeptide repeat protein [Kiritimatiellia bacterium]
MNTQRATLPPGLIYLLIGLIAWLVRWIYLLELSRHPAFIYPLIDAGEYHALAIAWAEGTRALPKLSWQPWLYPLVLGQIYTLLGPSVWIAKLLQITIGALSCSLAALLAYRIKPLPSLRWIAGLTAAFYGPLIHGDGELLAEPWAGLWLILIALAALDYRNHPRSRTALALGVLGALALFTRPPLLPAWLLAIAWATFVPSLPWTTRARHAGLLALAAVLTSLPWINAVATATGTPRLLPVTGGINFYIGNSHDPCHTINIRPGYAWENLTLWPELHGAHTPDQKDRFFRDQALSSIRTDPAAAAAHLLTKTRQFFSSREIPRNLDIKALRPDSLVLRLLVWEIGDVGFPFGLLAGFLLIGLWTAGRNHAALFLITLGYAAAIILVHVSDRYRLPVLPIWISFTALGIHTCAHALRSHAYLAAATCGGCLLLALAATSLGGRFCAEDLNYRAELMRIIAVTADTHGDRATSEAFARKALAEDPCEAHAHNQLGILEARRGNLREAEARFRAAVDCDPAISPAWFNLARIEIRRDQPQAAILYFRNGLEHAPAHLPAWIDLGDLLLRLGRTDEAHACYQEVLRIRPNFPPALQRIQSSTDPTPPFLIKPIQ